MGELPVDFFGERALLQHNNDTPDGFLERRHENIDQPADSRFRQVEIDSIFINRRATGLHLLDQGQERREGHDEIG